MIFTDERNNLSILGFYEEFQRKVHLFLKEKDKIRRLCIICVACLSNSPNKVTFCIQFCLFFLFCLFVYNTNLGYYSSFEEY